MRGGVSSLQPLASRLQAAACCCYLQYSVGGRACLSWALPRSWLFKIPLAQGIASLWHPCTGSSQAAWSWVVGLLGSRFFTRLMIADAHLRRNLGAENEPLCPFSKILLIVCKVCRNV